MHTAFCSGCLLGAPANLRIALFAALPLAAYRRPLPHLPPPQLFTYGLGDDASSWEVKSLLLQTYVSVNMLRCTGIVLAVLCCRRASAVLRWCRTVRRCACAEVAACRCNRLRVDEPLPSEHALKE